MNSRRPRLRVGMVGAGMVGQVAHLANFVNLPDCEVVALAELRSDLRELVASRYRVPKTYSTHLAMLEDASVEAVVAVTRPHAHGQIVLDALRAGRHVLSEKPMAHSLELAERLVAEADRGRRVYSVGYMKRHDAGTQAALQLLNGLRTSGELGRIVYLRAYCFGGEFRCGTDDFAMTAEVRPDGLETWPKAPDWMPAAHVDDYAWFLNVFIHDLNLIRHLSGCEPSVTSVDLSRRNGRTVCLDFGGYSGVLEMAEVASPDWIEGVDILFEKGRLSLRFQSPMLRNQPAQVELYRGAGGNEAITLSAPWSWAFQRQASAFVSDVRSGNTPLASGRDALGDLRLAEAIWKMHLNIRH